MEKVVRISKALGGLRTKFWFAKVAGSLGQTPTWFWRTIDKSNGDRATWERYKRGLRDAVPHGGRDRVALVDARYPGFAIYHRIAMWNLLDGAMLTNDEIVRQIANLDDPVRTIVLAGGYRSPEGDREFDRVCSELEEFPEFRSLACIVLMLAWADNLHNLGLWNALCGLYRHMIPAFIEQGGIPFHEEVFDAVDAFARERELTKLNVREDRFEDWRHQLPRLKKILEEQEYLRLSYYESMPRILEG